VAETEYEPVSQAEFDELFSLCSNWHRWGSDDERGALNLIDASHLAKAATLVREGRSISCGRDLETKSAVDNPSQALHYMVKLPGDDVSDSRETSAAFDFLGLECHGEVHSHIDALCHIAYNGLLYNGFSARRVTVEGAEVCGLDEIAEGILSRGVLLDIARLHGEPWLPAGYAISREELEGAEQLAHLEVGVGDVVLLRTGQSSRRKAEGPWDSAHLKAGLHPRAMPWFKEREIAAIAFDGDGDVEPHRTEGIRSPIHVLGINAMGLHFFDCLDLDDLAETCAALDRWEMLFTAAPLRLVGGTGCAINPIAMM
jgi:kynurenine formamidase